MSSQSPSTEFAKEVAKEFTKARIERWRDRARGVAHLSWQSLIPVAFVLCWASGFVVPRAFAPYIEPLTFVAIRNGAAAIALVIVVLALRSSWPDKWSDRAGLLWAGALLQGFSLMAVYWTIVHGLPVGVAALIGALQPALTAMLAAWLLGEALSRWQWVGIALGFAGVALVISPKLGTSEAHSSLVLGLLAFVGVACMAYASLFQKRFEKVGDPWSRTAIMFIGATVPALVAACLLERAQIEFAPALIAVWVWSVFALAIGATMALLFLIRKGQASRAASLIYLVPPVSALMAYAGFGEAIHLIQIAGFAVAASGVALVQLKERG
jgi:drug/metabolite transporter (DMT)-like permease